MKKLIQLELERFSLRPHIIGLLAANVIILLLCLFMSTFLSMMGSFMKTAGLPEMALTTVSISTMLVRAALIVWQGVLVAKFIIEEYQNKTICLLYTYHINRTKLIFAKLILICGIMLMFHVLSSLFQHGAVYLISRKLSFVTYSSENIVIWLLIIISTILLSLIPLTIGMIHKSSISTVVSSIVIVAFSSSSQGKTAGLLSIPAAALVMGLAGLLTAGITIRKMTASDLQV